MSVFVLLAQWIKVDIDERSTRISTGIAPVAVRVITLTIRLLESARAQEML
jgi:hypothetical protein